MRGINTTSISGVVGKAIAQGTTQHGDDFYRFDVGTSDQSRHVTWIPVIAYGGLAGICRNRVQPGSYVIVAGKIQREGPDIRVKADTITFLSLDREDYPEEPHGP